MTQGWDHSCVCEGIETNITMMKPKMTIGAVLREMAILDPDPATVHQKVNCCTVPVDVLLCQTSGVWLFSPCLCLVALLVSDVRCLFFSVQFTSDVYWLSLQLTSRALLHTLQPTLHILLEPLQPALHVAFLASNFTNLLQPARPTLHVAFPCNQLPTCSRIAPAVVFDGKAYQEIPWSFSVVLLSIDE